MLVDLNRANFLNRVVIIYLMKKILNSIFYRSFECVIEIDIDDIVISRDRKLVM